LRPGRTGMPYMTCSSHRMKKHKFGIMCPNTPFIETDRAHPRTKTSVSMFCAPDAPECTTWPANPIGFKKTKIRHYVTCRSQRKFGKHQKAQRVLMHFLWNWHQAQPSMKNYTSTFHGPNAPECTTWPVDPIGCKNTSLVLRVPMHLYENCTGPNRAWTIVLQCFAARMHWNALRYP
jgi:hypothetical protein